MTAEPDWKACVKGNIDEKTDNFGETCQNESKCPHFWHNMEHCKVPRLVTVIPNYSYSINNIVLCYYWSKLVLFINVSVISLYAFHGTIAAEMVSIVYKCFTVILKEHGFLTYNIIAESFFSHYCCDIVILFLFASWTIFQKAIMI